MNRPAHNRETQPAGDAHLALLANLSGATSPEHQLQAVAIYREQVGEQVAARVAAKRMSGRLRAMLVAKTVMDALRASGSLPKAKSLALVAQVAPSTARRWLADFRLVLAMKPTHLHGGAA